MRSGSQKQPTEHAAMATPNIQTVPLANLLVDLINPRHTEQPSQREAIATIAFDQGPKLANLAEDIAERGLNPGELFLVTPADHEGMYYVLEGNRRIASLKLMTSPGLLASLGLPKNVNTRFKDLHRDYAASLPTQIICSVLTRDEARHWILQKHTGENDGTGIVMWDGRARHRFRGMSPALQALELVEESDYLTDDTKKLLQKISITNIERILGTPGARQALGVDVKKSELVFLAPEPEALGRLAMVVDDIANKRMKVTDLDSKDQRIAYAEEVANRPLPKSVSGNRVGAPPGGGGAGAGAGTGKTIPPRRIKPDRKPLIPPKFKIAIHHPRINRIYHELMKLNADDFVNCAAVMFRVFIELSIDHYGVQKMIDLTYLPKVKPGITPEPKELSLREKIKKVTQYMEDNKILTRDELKGVRTLTAKGDHVLSVDSLNAYVHNKDYHPVSSDLKANWDGIQIFVEKLWTV